MRVGKIERGSTVTFANRFENRNMITEGAKVHMLMLLMVSPNVQGRTEADFTVQISNDVVEHGLLGRVDDRMMEPSIGRLGTPRVPNLHRGAELIERM